MVPLYVIVYFSGMKNAHLLALLVYALATFTDFLDGYLARKNNCITNLGKVLDPLGDKMLTTAVLVCLLIDGIIPGWIVLIIVAKEVLMGLGGLVIHRKAKVEIPPSNYIGKTATVLFFVVCAILMLFNIDHNVAVALVSLAVAVSLAAFVSYLCRFIRIMKLSKTKE
ncbi:MAG: CDP-alcohol phosphatidyltransferase family protein [Oscillospiraceae bacterium]|nr:CDP-alcohol phosphatidyltransferase family protein [Oscillospiraceae bacterium]